MVLTATAVPVARCRARQAVPIPPDFIGSSNLKEVMRPGVAMVGVYVVQEAVKKAGRAARDCLVGLLPVHLNSIRSATPRVLPRLAQGALSPLGEMIGVASRSAFNRTG